ncbi:single-stranded DNA-binding protein [Arsenicicoccus dermatophilus]|uniref:single-stranded DNA-binding protein n=1 Tax=Arsenicicoccus dermatophilus TaxID=1076331 RepID=UPI00391719CD
MVGELGSGEVDEVTVDEQPTDAASVEEGADVNEVRLRGRVAADPVTRELPSGDLLVSLRIVVRRGGSPSAGTAAPPGRRAPTVDAIDVGCWSGETAEQAGSLVPGQVVEVAGSLHRRFWRTPAGVTSRYEVRATALDVLRGTPVEPDGRARPTVQA